MVATIARTAQGTTAVFGITGAFQTRPHRIADYSMKTARTVGWLFGCHTHKMQVQFLSRNIDNTARSERGVHACLTRVLHIYWCFRITVAETSAHHNETHLGLQSMFELNTARP